KNGRGEMSLLGDRQRLSLADPETLFRWELLAGERGLRGQAASGPQLWYVNVAGERASSPPNYALAPLAVNRPVVPVDREVTFRGDIVLSGQSSYSPPHRVRLEGAGKHIRDLPPVGGAAG